MKSMEEIVNQSAQEQIVEDLNVQYDKIIEALQKAKDEQQPIDEGLFGAIGGAIVGSTILPKVMKAVCGALGVNENGQLGSLLTSKLVMTAVGTTVGWKW